MQRPDDLLSCSLFIVLGTASLSAVELKPTGTIELKGANIFRLVRDGVLVTYRERVPAKKKYIGDAGIALQSLEDGKVVRKFVGHQDQVRAIALIKGGKQFISASKDTTLRVWDFNEDVPKKVLKGHTGDVLCVSVSANGRYAVSGSQNSQVILWDLRRGKKLRAIDYPEEPPFRTPFVNGVGLGPKGRYVFTAADDHRARLWDIKKGTVVGEPIPLGRRGSFARFLPGKKPAGLFVGMGGKIVLWRGGRTTELAASGAPFTFSVSVGPKGRRAFTSDESGKVYVWDLVKGRMITELDVGKGTYVKLSLSPDGKRLLTSVGGRPKATLWSVK